ncbi:TPA: hypothetical protein L7K86_000708 [Klebsiella pneumoniae]|uniref:hypothetical protein n=1 Tax=Klebsiella TaxID=570 RepID=UPI0009407A49|nr:hypothetical protein [Klebsiella pneumoniae]HDU3920406.1 hypothetical protein [Klebsiella pneumoniae subsp. pneumoniae]MBM1094471.1 hypothetical protein [Klebsiella pneumoniae]MCQ8713215.1 hypothetical protein [Klebsiella pneumoniae]MDU9136398.1 hypothetical protein [Klebsiella pneumoniae]MDU9198961.1 hypothetical protein [Klebsiella pneumoniae]
MKKKILIFLCVLIISACGDKTESQLKNEAKEAVTKKLSQNYKPDECRNWKVMASSGLAPMGRTVAICDDGFNVSKGLTFSDLSVYRNDDGYVVCGIVSGQSDISRIGARFVYAADSKNSLFIKMSKYPMFLSGGSTSRQLVSQLTDIYNQTYREMCK